MRAPVAVVAALAALALAAHADAGNQPRILEFEYSEDDEMIGRHHNMYATLKGDAERVVARWNGERSEGKFDDVAGPQSYWNFRDRDFVRGLLDDLHADGAAVVKVKAVGATRTVRKECSLTLEPDAEFGDYATGPCRKL
jgi:hypothetical protein